MQDEDTYKAEFSVLVDSGRAFWNLVIAAPAIVEAHLAALDGDSATTSATVSTTGADLKRMTVHDLVRAMPADQMVSVPKEFVSTWRTPKLKVTVSRWSAWNREKVGYDDLFRVFLTGPTRLLVQQNEATMASDFRAVAQRAVEGVFLDVPGADGTARVDTHQSLITAPATASVAATVTPPKFRLPAWTDNSLVGGFLATALFSGGLWAVGQMGSLSPELSRQLSWTAGWLAALLVPVAAQTALFAYWDRPKDRQALWKIAGRAALFWFAALGVYFYGNLLNAIWTTGS